MEVYCGNYLDYKPKKRIPWLRYIFILLLVTGTTAATPAVISYYWDGKNSIDLPEEPSRVIAEDVSRPFHIRLAAASNAYTGAYETIDVLFRLMDESEFRIHELVNLRNLRKLINDGLNERGEK